MSHQMVHNQDMSIQAVRTTGIYCRAECAANPQRENVQEFPNTFAAEAAGFRPCLRCRPERSADVLRDGAPPAVEQALLLINEGYLDRHTEADLARVVGYSTRHLRRVFDETVGASASSVARSRRAHFARRLLDESDLTIAAISNAAGFANRRQMNRTMLDVFRFTPTELRARRRATDRLTADGGLRLRVPFEGAMDWDLMLSHIGPRAVPGVETVVGRRYRRVTTTCGHPGVLEVAEGDDRHHLEVAAHLPTFDSIIDDVARIRRLFGLLRRTPVALEEDEIIGPLIRRRPGIRITGAWSPFETAIRIILGQQISVAAATTLSGRVAATFGQPLEGSPLGLVRIFPPAAVLADASFDDIGVPQKRGDAIRSFAAAVASGVVDLVGYPSLEETVGALEELPGIGPWTSHMMAIRIYGHPDAFPATDAGLRRAVGRRIGEERPSPATVEFLAERWRPHRAFAAQHLWMSLNDDEN